MIRSIFSTVRTAFRWGERRGTEGASGAIPCAKRGLLFGGDFIFCICCRENAFSASTACSACRLCKRPRLLPAGAEPRAKPCPFPCPSGRGRAFQGAFGALEQVALCATGFARPCRDRKIKSPKAKTYGDFTILAFKNKLV